MAKSDIVLITFPFTDLSGSKLRPAVVLVDTPMDITVSFITTQVGYPRKYKTRSGSGSCIFCADWKKPQNAPKVSILGQQKMPKL